MSLYHGNRVLAAYRGGHEGGERTAGDINVLLTCGRLPLYAGRSVRQEEHCGRQDSEVLWS